MQTANGRSCCCATRRSRARLTLDEFAERVERTELARTDTELAEIAADLPSTGVADLPGKHGAVFARLEPRRPLGAVAEVEGASRSAARSMLDLGQARRCTAPRRRHARAATSSGPSTLLVPRGVHVSVDGGGAFWRRATSSCPTPARSATRRGCGSCDLRSGRDAAVNRRVA